MKSRKIISIILCVAVVLSSIAVSSYVLATNSDDSTPSVIYDFENGQTLPYSGMSYATEDLSDGTNTYMSYSVQTGTGYPLLSFRTDYILQKDREYTVNFKYKFSGITTSTGALSTYLAHPFRPVLGDWGNGYNFYACNGKYNMETANLYAQGENKGFNFSNTNGEWFSASITFNTTDFVDKINSTDKYLGFVMQFSPDKTVTLCIDDIEIVPTEINSYIKNGGFEDGKWAWESESDFGELSSDFFDGANSLKLANGKYSTIYQIVTLNSDTNYLFSFWYKGATTGAANWAICKNSAAVEEGNIIKSGSADSTDNWKKQQVIFNTGDCTDIILLFQSVAGCDFIIDNVVITDTLETAADEAYTAPTLIGDSDLSKNCLFVAADGTNLITDNSFEAGNGNWLTLTNDSTLTVSEEKSHSGKKSLKFSASGLEKDCWSYAYFQVEPETDYFLSAWVLGENWSKTNKNDMRFGIVNADNGYFILADSSMSATSARRYTKNEQLTCSAWDGYWHLLNIKFNSGSAESIAFGIMGSDSVAYFDEIQLFKASDSVQYKAYHQTLADANVLDTVPKKTNCIENLILNSDLSEKDSTFWQSAGNFGISEGMQYYGNFLDIKDTDTEYGNALYYKANTSVTGVPLQTYYFKWIDIKPQTDYTFSADVSILEEGGGYIQIIDNNPFYPNSLGEYYFNKTSNYEKYIKNCGFENGLNNWSGIYTAETDTISITTENSYNGDSALKCSGGNYLKAYQSFNCEKNTDYSVSFMVYAPKVNYGSKWGIKTGSSAGNVIAADDDETIYIDDFAKNSGWKKITVNINSGNNESLKIIFQSLTGNEYYIDDIYIHRTDEDLYGIYTSDEMWQKYAVKFNSGDYNKIGILVMDGGGEAYIDNLRLFETDNAVVETIDECDMTGDTFVNIIDLVRMKKYLSDNSISVSNNPDIAGDEKIDTIDLSYLKKLILGVYNR